VDDQRPVGSDVSGQGMSIRRDELELSEEFLSWARRRALGGVVFTVALLPVLVAFVVLADDWWVRAVAAVMALLSPMSAIRSLREYRHPDLVLRPTLLRDVLNRTLDREKGEAVPFPDAESIPARILLLQEDLDLIEESPELRTSALRSLLVRIERAMGRSSNALLRLLARQVTPDNTLSHRVFLFSLVVSLIMGLILAIVVGAAGATVMGAAAGGAVVTASLMGFFYFVGGMLSSIDRSKSRPSRAADILRGELATARRALSQDVTDELRAHQDSS